MRAVYIFCSYLLLALLFPVLLLHRKTRDGFWQRLGFYRPGDLPQGPGRSLWLHGASAGDLLALSPMIGPLKERFPDARIVLSTITNSGYLMAMERLRHQVDAVVFAPWDIWGATRRAARAIRPALLVLEYTEIWPNLIRAATRAGARIALTNGRFSPGHLRSYRALFATIGNPLGEIDAFLMRADDEAERALLLGADRSRVFVTGNTKFDALIPLAQAPDDRGLREALGLDDSHPTWIAGSTHEGEEQILLGVFTKLRDDFPSLRMVIAPRYIDRAAKVVAIAQGMGLSAAVRTSGAAREAAVVVLDTIGELARAYRLATLVFVGGSFTTRGGQNILEPAAQGRPVLFGPHMENFHDSVQVLVGRGGIQVKDGDHLRRVALELLSRPDQLASLGDLARSTVHQISGASLRNVEHLSRLIAA